MRNLLHRMCKLNRYNHGDYLFAFLLLFVISFLGIRQIERSKAKNIMDNRIEAVSTEIFTTNDTSGQDPIIYAGIEFFPPNSSQNSKATISLRGIYVYLPDNIQADRFCLANPVFYYQVVRNPYLTLSGAIPPTNHDDNLCVSLDKENHAPYSEINIFFIEFVYSEHQAELFTNVYEWDYPYDRLSVNISFTTSYSFYYNNKETITSDQINLPIFLAYDGYLFEDPLRYSGWTVNISRNIAFDDSSSTTNHNYESSEYLNFELQRPISIQIIIPIVFLVIFGFIVSLLFTTDYGTFIEGSVGVFFGLFSIKNVLIPKEFTITTMIDQFILYSYLAFALVFVIFAFRKYSSQKTGGLNRQSVKSKQTKKRNYFPHKR